MRQFLNNLIYGIGITVVAIAFCYHVWLLNGIKASLDKNNKLVIYEIMQFVELEKESKI